MKKRSRINTYLKALEIIYNKGDCSNNYTCLAIDCVSKKHNSKARYVYESLMKPDYAWQTSWVHGAVRNGQLSSSKMHEWRLTALAFMDAIVNDKTRPPSNKQN
jgi:hypothetical protein